MNVFQPALDPLGSLTGSALVALIPIVVMLVTLGILGWKAHWAGLSALASALLIAILVYDMPAGMAGMSALQGGAFGIFPILWILLMAIWMYDVTVVSGRFEDLRDTFYLITDDPRVLGILVAFCFGGLLEALAGFGAPVAITAVMLMAVGFSPMRAAVTVLLANTAPVAFGAVGTPVIMAGNVSGLDYNQIGAYVGVQTSIMAFFVPFLLLLVMDGWRGLRQAWPAALVIGAAFAVAQRLTSGYVSVELTDVMAAMAGILAGVVLLRFWQPGGSPQARTRMASKLRGEPDSTLTADQDQHQPQAHHLTPARIWMALLPYVLVVALFGVVKLIGPISAALSATDISFGWPGLEGRIVDAAGEPVTRTTFTFGWLSSPGTLLMVIAILTAAIYRVPAGKAWASLRANAYQLRFTGLTIASVVALAYVMDFSGQTITIGTWIAGTGALFAFLSPVLGWIGTYVTGSDTTANALFGGLQTAVGHQTGIDPYLTVAANTSGGVLGKMISPQNLAIAATAVGLGGHESLLLRRMIAWSFGMLVVLCLIVGLMNTPVLSWLLPA